MPSGLALADGHVDTKHFTDVLGYTRGSFVQNPAARIVWLVRGSDPITSCFVASSKVFGIFGVQDDAVAEHRRIATPLK